MAKKLIRNCDLLSFTSGKAEVVPGQDVLIDDCRIQTIQKTGTLAPEAETEIIPADGLLAVPGFINTHAHVPMVLIRNLAEDVTPTEWFNDYIWPMESNLTEEDVYWGAQLGIAEMIENGVTCVADHYFYVDRIAEVVQQSGIRANLTWAVFGHEGEAKVDETIDFINRWQGKADGRITTYLGPHAPYTTSPEFLQMCAEKAKKINTGIHIHVSETAPQVELSLEQYGITPVKQLQETGIFEVPTILGHCLYPREGDFEILAAANTGIAQAPKTYMKHGMGMAPIEKYLEYGIPIGMATDGPASNNTLDIMEQMRLMALFTKLMTSDPTRMKMEQVLDIAFRSSAKVMHLDGQIGEIKAGCLADIALLRQDGLYASPKANPMAALIYCMRASDVDTVLCNGKVLMQGRKLLTMDKETIRKEVQSRLKRMSQRVPGTAIAFYPT
ncbi:MAG: amidohydrolase [Caldisericales bacterium]|nr:amidohydrolase [Caldisericales bacterium]